ncbi:MAG: hypothetical protein OEX02_04145 [Cyclobacteriaceae bacterium]|nr:hypothetical protein [Cyclobacteriaceae bacterium]
MRYLCLFFLLFPVLYTSGQISQPARYEVEKKFGDNDFTVFSAKEDGLVMFRETDKYNKERDELWQIIILDTTLNVRHELEIGIDDEYSMLGYEYQEGRFFLLFRKGLTTKSDWFIINVDLYSGEYIHKNIRNELEIELTHFIGCRNSLVLGGAISGRPTVVLYSVEEDKVEVLPGFFRNDAKLLDMQTNKNGTFNVLFHEKDPLTGHKILYLKVFSNRGILLLESSSNFGEEIKVNSGTTSHLESDDLVIIGNYGDKNSKLSNGVYFINVRPGHNDNIKYIPFADFDRLFHYLGERRERKIKEKIKNSPRNNPYEFRTTMVVWKIVEDHSMYLVYGEIIDPQYQSSPHNRPYSPFYYDNLGYPFYGYYRRSPSYVGLSELTSIKYREGVVAAFNKTGNLLWDESMLIDDVETSYLDQVMDFNAANDNFHMGYKHDDGLRLSFGQGSRLIVNDSLINVRLMDDFDTVRSEEVEFGKLNLWYDDVYFLWGHHRLTNTLNNERRNVFYVNKVQIK